MINKTVEQITEKDLQSLIDNTVLERKNLEYKQEIEDTTDNNKREFLADVSSFANANGGDLIFGISTKEEIPQALVGIDITPDRITKLDSIIRDGIDPRLPSVVIQPVTLSNSKSALIIRVAKSWLSPHRVTYRGHDKFYSRSTNGKYSLDVSELRIAFNLSVSLAERIRRFREDRISKINADEMPVSITGTAKIVLHLMPLISFNPGQRYDIKKEITNQLHLIGRGGHSSTYNLDGLITYSGSATEKPQAYTLLFKNGVIEAVDSHILSPHYIPSVSFEKELIDAVKRYLNLLQERKIELPIVLFLTLLNVKGYRMAINDAKFHFPSNHPIDRNIILLPEVMIESYEVLSHQILKPCFDAIWNACGFEESLNYNDNGDWREH